MADINKTTKIWTSEPRLIHPSGPVGNAGKGRPRKWPTLHPQNTARYVAGGKLVEEPFTTLPIAAANLAFGRRYQIISFRWLSDTEI